MENTAAEKNSFFKEQSLVIAILITEYRWLGQAF